LPYQTLPFSGSLNSLLRSHFSELSYETLSILRPRSRDGTRCRPTSYHVLIFLDISVRLFSCLEIGPTSGDAVLPKQLSTISFLGRLIGVAPSDNGTTNQKSGKSLYLPPACKISHKKWGQTTELITQTIQKVEIAKDFASQSASMRILLIF
jgi:hypothetical protein